MTPRTPLPVFSALLLSFSIGLSGAAASGRTEAADVNLLHGDPDFEIGLVGWHAHAGPWRSTDLSNSHFKSRSVAADVDPIDSPVAFSGKRSVRLAPNPDDRAYVTSTAPVTLGRGTWTFSAHARCSRPTSIQLRILDEAGDGKPGARDFYAAAAKTVSSVSGDWKQIALKFDLSAPGRLVPIIDVLGTTGDCWLDALMLNQGGSPQAYARPGKPVAALRMVGPFATPMPGLLLTQRPAGATARLTLDLLSDGAPGTHSATVWTEDPEGRRRQVTTLELETKAREVRHADFELNLPHTGIWKVVATIRSPSGEITEAETVVATMTPHQGPPDTFFGTQQKLSPLVGPMGFGAVRDMHLLRWNDVMPASDKWVAPDPEEIDQIRTFVEKGGLYLATLVAENPSKTGYAAAHWGKPDYGGVPAWAQSGEDAAPGELKKAMRAVQPDALAAYAEEAARRYPFLAFEVMNEPIHYLRPDNYAAMLATVYRAIKHVAPAATVVGMGSPPPWFHLPGGAKTRVFGPQPFHWYDEVLEAGGGRHMDAIGIHPYDRGHKNEVPENAYIPGGQADWARQLRQLAERATPGKPLPVWVTEKGSSSPSWRESRRFKSGGNNHRLNSSLAQARWIVRSQIDMRAHGVRHFFLWNQLWSSSATHRFFPFEDIRYTLFDSDGLPRPALIAQKVLIENLSGVEPVAQGEFRKGARYALFRSNNRLVAALWAYGSDQAQEERAISRAIACPQLAGASERISLFGDTSPYMCDGKLALTASPIYIRGNDPALADVWKRALEALK